MIEQEKRYTIFRKKESAVVWLIFSVSRDEKGTPIQRFLIFHNYFGIGSDLPCEKAEIKSFQMWGITCFHFQCD